MHSARLSILLVAVLTAAPAFAQELGEGSAEKTDLSNPDRISRPPMDPFSLSYTPDMPEGAQDIRDAESCAAAKGKWTRQDAADIREVFNDEAEYDPDDNTLLEIEGCIIDEKRQGRWTYIAHEAPSGFVWYIDDHREGWDVILDDAPDAFVRRLRHFHDAGLDGTSFAWDENGSLIRVETWKDGVRNGKYEEYENSLPLVTGTYTDGKPTGTWTFYDEDAPGKPSRHVNYDRRATAADLPEGTPEDTVAFWTEWIAEKGVTVVTGFAKVDEAEPLEPGKRIGKQNFFTEVGNHWIDVTYDIGGIHDTYVNQLCIPENEPNKAASYLNFDHGDVVLECKDENSETYRKVYFYGSGEVWKTETRKGNSKTDKLVIEYHKTKEILAQYETRNDVPEGEMRYVHPDGTPMGRATIITAGTGTYRSWWYNGNKREEGKYENGRKNGTWQKWYESGTMESEENYTRGTQSGPAREWYANGVLSSEFNYKMGVPDGRVFVNYPDGRIGQEATFAMGMLVGVVSEYNHSGTLKNTVDHAKHPMLSTDYYSTGERMAQGAVIDGMLKPVREGAWKFYLKDGVTVWYEANYSFDMVDSPDADMCRMRGGKFVIDEEEHTVGCVMSVVNRTVPTTPLDLREGSWTWYNVRGGIEKRGSIHFGRQHGDWEFFYPNGKPMLRGQFELDRKTGEWHAFYEDGSRKFEGHYVDGVEDGIWTTYYQKTETPSSQGAYANGKRVDTWKWFYGDGTVREEGNYENGVETGVWKSYYPSGKPEGAGNYENGQRAGEWTWWREDGKVWKTATYFEGKEIQ